MKAVLADFETAPIDERLRVALRFVRKMTLEPQRLGRDDLDRLREAGVNERGMDQLAQICAAFNIITRIADTLEFEVPSWDKALRAGAVLLKRGYR